MKLKCWFSVWRTAQILEKTRWVAPGLSPARKPYGAPCEIASSEPYLNGPFLFEQHFIKICLDFSEFLTIIIISEILIRMLLRIRMVSTQTCAKTCYQFAKKKNRPGAEPSIFENGNKHRYANRLASEPGSRRRPEPPLRHRRPAPRPVRDARWGTGRLGEN